MALGGKMHDGARPVLLKQRRHQFAIGNIALHEKMPRISLQRIQVRRIARVGQEIEIHNGRTGALQPGQYEVRPNKTGPAGDKNRVLHRCSMPWYPTAESWSTNRKGLEESGPSADYVC